MRASGASSSEPSRVPFAVTSGSLGWAQRDGPRWTEPPASANLPAMNLRAGGFLGRVIVVTSSLIVGTGCSGDDGGLGGDGNGGTNTGGTSGATGGSANGSGGSALGGSAQGGSSGGGTPPLFTSAPDCDTNVERLEGTFQGTTVAVDQSTGPSTLTGRTYYTVRIGRSRVRLQWGNAIAPNVVQPLTGGYVLTFWDAANPEVLYCVTAGEIGFIETESSNEYFKYSITGVRSGEVGTTPNSQPARCDGEELTVNLLGCVKRD